MIYDFATSDRRIRRKSYQPRFNQVEPMCLEMEGAPCTSLLRVCKDIKFEVEAEAELTMKLKVAYNVTLALEGRRFAVPMPLKRELPRWVKDKLRWVELIFVDRVHSRGRMLLCKTGTRMTGFERCLGQFPSIRKLDLKVNIVTFDGYVDAADDDAVNELPPIESCFVLGPIVKAFVTTVDRPLAVSFSQFLTTRNFVIDTDLIQPDYDAEAPGGRYSDLYITPNSITYRCTPATDPDPKVSYKGVDLEYYRSEGCVEDVIEAARFCQRERRELASGSDDAEHFQNLRPGFRLFEDTSVATARSKYPEKCECLHETH